MTKATTIFFLCLIATGCQGILQSNEAGITLQRLVYTNEYKLATEHCAKYGKNAVKTLGNMRTLTFECR